MKLGSMGFSWWWFKLGRWVIVSFHMYWGHMIYA
jgi:hypothetical protein